MMFFHSFFLKLFQLTNIDGVYAIGNVASEIDLLVVAKAQEIIVAHDAYRKLRGW